MPEQGALTQFGIVAAFLVTAKIVFDFAKEMVQFRSARKEAKEHAESGNGHDDDSEEFQSKLLIQSSDFRRLIEAIETNTEAVKKLLLHEDDERRILHRIEKQLDLREH